MVCIYISYTHVNQKVHGETVLTSFCYKKCTIKATEKNLNNMKSWYYYSKRVILMMSPISFVWLGRLRFK